MHKSPIKAITALLALLFALPALCEPMSFRSSSSGGNCNGCEWVAAQGEITVDTPQRFKEYLVEHQYTENIILDSDGGDLEAAIELGVLFRELSATTLIGETVKETEEGFEHFDKTLPGVCAHACAYAFMGGRNRIVEPDSRLGLYQFYSLFDGEIDTAVIEEVAGTSLIHMLQMEVDPRAISVAPLTRIAPIHWFSREELSLFNLDTSIERTDPWKLEPYLDGLVLTTIKHVSRRRSVAITLFCRQKDKAWRLLLSEKDQGYEDQLNGIPLLNFTGNTAARPSIWLSGTQYNVDERSVEFQRFVDGKFLVSINLPQVVEESGEELLSFAPDLDYDFGAFIGVGVELPSGVWVIMAKRNCI